MRCGRRHYAAPLHNCKYRRLRAHDLNRSEQSVNISNDGGELKRRVARSGRCSRLSYVYEPAEAAVPRGGSLQHISKTRVDSGELARTQETMRMWINCPAIKRLDQKSRAISSLEKRRVWHESRRPRQLPASQLLTLFRRRFDRRR